MADAPLSPNPPDSQQLTIFIVVGQGISLRCLLESEIFDLFVAAGARVVALVPDPTEPYLVERIASRGVILEQIRTKDPTKGGGLTRKALAYLRKWATPGTKSPAFRNRYRLKDQRVDEKTRWPRFYAFLGVLVTSLVWRSRWLRRRILRWDMALNTEAGHADLFDRYQPSLALSGTLGHIRWDGIVLREAQERGLPVAAAMVSWDNASSKEYRMFDPDLVVAWSDEMVDQLETFQDIDPAKTYVAGAYHWDRYIRPGALLDRAELCEALGLDPERRLILFAAPPPKSYVAGGRMSGYLAAAVESGELGTDSQLVIRMHPNSFAGSANNRVVEQMEEVAATHDHSVLSVPQIVSSRLGGAVSQEDLRLLGSLIKHADVLVNLFSTTTLEAFLADTPVVLVNDDVGLTPEELESAGEHRYDEFSHLEKIQAGATVAHDLDEVLAAIRAYLEDPSLDAGARAAVALEECGPMDGYAARRAGARLLQLAGVEPAEIKRAEAGLGGVAGAGAIPAPPAAATMGS